MTRAAAISGFIIIVSWALAGCGASNPPEMSDGHLKAAPEQAEIPEPAMQAPVLPEPEQRPDLETYTVIVNQVPVRELLFSMARDARLNLDIDNNISGLVTMNAIDQTLPRILQRLARQVDISYQIEDDTLHVSKDTPYLQTYKIDYLNMSRSSTGTVNVSTEMSSTGSGAGDQQQSSNREGNSSKTELENKSRNYFWATLAVNISSIIGEDAKASGDESLEISNNIILNRESGLLAVRATQKQHKQIREFVDLVMNSAKRQVLIEATIAEVTLSDRYQSGIDWSYVTGTATDPGTGVLINEGALQDVTGANLGQTPFFSLTSSGTPGGDALNVTLKALETFGDVKVLSSPKVMALNNQTAMLKVVDNEVYFTADVETSVVTTGGVSTLLPPVVDTELNTVPIGFVMSVTPYIDENDVVTLNVRPTISRIIDFKQDPNPEFKLADVVSEVPVIQVREIESVLKINNGDTAVIGGLMQDQINKTQSGIPILSSIPLIGALFSYIDDEYVKSELVIFIRPVVAHDASLTGDLKEYNKYLLSSDDFELTDSESESE